MPLIESVKENVEKITGWARPSLREVDAVLRRRKPNVFRFGDDGAIPNNPELPFIVYRGPVRLVDAPDPAALFEVLFARNGWKGSWRNGIYDYVHYHSRTHEVLGIARGEARVRFGGSKGRVVKLRAGDVAILPAGTGQCPGERELSLREIAVRLANEGYVTPSGSTYSASAIKSMLAGQTTFTHGSAKPAWPRHGGRGSWRHEGGTVRSCWVRLSSTLGPIKHKLLLRSASGTACAGRLRVPVLH